MDGIAIQTDAGLPLVDFTGLTFPSYHAWLAERQPEILAVAARQNGAPAGLCLADSRVVPAVIHSIAVARSHRRKGVASALLCAMERELVARGCAEAQIEFTQGSFSIPMSRLLAACGWEPPRLHMRIFKTASATMARIPWVCRLKRPNGIEIAPWADLDEVENGFIRASNGQPGGHPCWLDPFFEEDRVIQETSLIARQAGKLIGWGINHQVVPGVHRFSRYWVGERFQPLGLGAVLMAEAARRIDIRQFSQVVCGVWEENAAMVAFCERRIAPHCVVTKAFLSNKRLGLPQPLSKTFCSTNQFEQA